jgi:hypothetical protein
MQLGVIYLKTCGSTKCHVAFWTLEFHSCCSVYSATLPENHFLPFWTQCSFASSLFTWLHNGACTFLGCDLSLRHPAHLLDYVPHQHTSGIISNHNMQHVITGTFQNICYVVSLIHLPCIPITVLQYGQFQRFSMCIIEFKLCWQKKHICQYIYVRSFIHIMPVKLQLTLVCTSPCLFQFCQTLLALLLYLPWQSHNNSLSRKINHQITEQISWLCTICVPHFRSSYSSSSSCYRESYMFRIFATTQSYCMVLGTIYIS